MTHTRIVLGLSALALLSACKSKEEVLKHAEEQGQLLAEKKARLVKGVGEGLQTEGKAAGEEVAKGAAVVARGIAQGATEGFNNLPLTITPELGAAGMKAERAAVLREDAKTPQVKVYLVLDKPFKGELTLITRSKEGSEVGRSKLAVDEPATGKWVVFSFDKLVDLETVTAVELK